MSTLDGLKMATAEDLQGAVASGEVTLVLGAGVSRSRNVPGWQELAARLWEWAFSEPYPLSGSDHPFAHQFAMELIEQELHSSTDYGDETRSRDPFVEAIGSCLYEGVDAENRGAAGDTLGIVARLLRQQATRSERQIRSVVAFNVDSLLEEEVHRYSRAGRPLVWPVSRASDDVLRAPGAIRVYHVHGYVPGPNAAAQLPRVAIRKKRPAKRGPPTQSRIRKRSGVVKTTYHQLIDSAPDTFVFTDWQYWRLSTTPLSFSNRILGDVLHGSCCLFVGLSMTDVNLIRWLGARSVELELDVRSELNMPRISPGARGYRLPHFWIRPKTDDPTGLLGRFLSLRGVRSIEIDSWSSRSFEQLMQRSFKLRGRR